MVMAIVTVTPLAEILIGLDQIGTDQNMIRLLRMVQKSRVNYLGRTLVFNVMCFALLCVCHFDDPMLLTFSP